MRRFRTVRVATVLALAVPASLVAWSAAGPASAAVIPSCTALAGVGLNSTVSGCTPAANTGGKGTAKSVAAAKGQSGTTTITWAAGHGTSKLSFTYAIPKVNKCPKGSTEIIETGKILSSTGLAAKVILKGQKTSASACEGKTVSLLKGTKFVL
jgi:hypothetical protein